MADNRERKKEDLYIKETKKSKNFFITSSAKMDGDKDRTSTTISSSVFTKMKDNFDSGDFLLDSNLISQNGSIIYMLQQMQEDLSDVYNEVSASAFEASYFPFATIDSGSFGLISSSLIPDNDKKHNLGSSGKEWHTSYQTTASIGGGIFTSASLAAGGGSNITVDTSLTNGSTNPVTNNAVFDGLATKLNLKGGIMTGLIQPIVTTLKSVNKGIVDATSTNVFEFNIKLGATVDVMRSNFIGQEVTIVNLGQGAITITHTAKLAADSFFIAGGKNLTITTAQAYKFVMTNNRQWVVIQ